MIKALIKLFSTIFLIFTLGISFVGQNLIVNAADPVVPPATTSTTAPAPKPTSTKSDGPSIGSLKACVVDKSRKDISSDDGNKIIRECIKSVINLVITLAVLISIASLVGYGIQLMNPMMESGKINGQIVERIKSLAIGGFILGSFGTILATINPATLTSNQLLGKPVIDSFREYISLGVKNSPPSKGGTGTAGGTGTTGTASTAEITTAITTVSTNGKIDKAKLDSATNAATKKVLQDAVDKEDECTDIFATGTGCVGYVKIEKAVLKSLNDAGLKSSYDANSSLTTVPGPVIANYDMTVTKDSNDTSGIYTSTIKVEGKDETQKFKITGAAGQLCPVTNLFFQPPPKAGQTIIKAGCTLTILK